MFAVKIQNAKSLEEKEQAKAEKIRHIQRAENLSNRMNCDFQEAQNLSTIECLTFDLEKSLPLPHIPSHAYQRLWHSIKGNCGCIIVVSTAHPMTLGIVMSG